MFSKRDVNLFKQTEISFNDAESVIRDNPNLNFDFIIKFKDNSKAYEKCLGFTTFDLEYNDKEIHFENDGLILNPSRSIQDPLNLLIELRDDIDFIFS